MGKNTYGHPSEEVIKRLEEHKITVLRNDEQGAVGIRVNKAGDFGIVTMRN